jgi:hypothetical protein
MRIGREVDELPYWPKFSEEFYRQILEENPSLDILAAYFPGRGYSDSFFGPFIDCVCATELMVPLAVFRKTLLVRGIIQAKVGVLDSALNYDNMLESDEGMLAAEIEASKLVQRIMNLLNSEECMAVGMGDGYAERLNSESSSPQAHLIHAEIRLSEAYAKWIKPRVAMYNGLGELATARIQAFLKATNRTAVISRDSGDILAFDAYGFPRDMTSWAPRLDYYSEEVAGDGLGSIEVLIGLIHFSDVLAAIHLMTVTGTVYLGRYEHSDALDALTDLWYHVYGRSKEEALLTGCCEVCHGLFVTSNKAKRGHESCMNRQRVKKARAYKYASLVEQGVDARTAARKASISASTAVSVLEQANYCFKPAVNYRNFDD